MLLIAVPNSDSTDLRTSRGPNRVWMRAHFLEDDANYDGDVQHVEPIEYEYFPPFEAVFARGSVVHERAEGRRSRCDERAIDLVHPEVLDGDGDRCERRERTVIVTALSPTTLVVPAVTWPLLTTLHVANISGTAVTLAVTKSPPTSRVIPSAATIFLVDRTVVYAPAASANSPATGSAISFRFHSTGSEFVRPRTNA